MIPSKETIAAMASMATSTDGKVVVAFFKNKLASLDKASRRKTGEDLLIMNGRRQELEEIVSALETAEEALSRKKAPIQPGDRY